MDERKERLMEAIAERVKPEVIQEENEALKAQLKELNACYENLKEKCMELKNNMQKEYMRGRVDGLEFSIRCNGVSGDIVK